MKITDDSIPKKKVMGKSKGNSFERKIANLLSARFSDLLKVPTGFRRNPDSGSFFGGSNVSRVDTHDTDYAIFGDLICPRSFLFSIECKHYKSAPSFQLLLNEDVKQWDKWILQAEQDSKKSNKHMLLIIKYNNVDEFAFTSTELENIRIAFVYKDKFAYKLSDLLLQPDNVFFNI